MNTKAKRVRNFIYSMRRNRSLLQKQLAALLGQPTNRSVSEYERGTTLPPLQTAVLLELALGIRLEHLYPDLYRDCLQLVLARAERLPVDTRRSLIERLKHQYKDQSP